MGNCCIRITVPFFTGADELSLVAEICAEASQISLIAEVEAEFLPVFISVERFGMKRNVNG